MKPTKVWSLLVAIAATAIAAYALVRVVISNGGQVPVSGLNLIITLPVIAVLELIFAIPLIRYRRALTKAKSASEVGPKRVDPFYAVRVLLLSKATAISGSIFTGYHAGLIAVQTSAPVLADAIWFNVFGLIGSAMLAIVGYIIERFCRLPEDGNQLENTAKSSNAEATPA